MCNYNSSDKWLTGPNIYVHIWTGELKINELFLGTILSCMDARNGPVNKVSESFPIDLHGDKALCHLCCCTHVLFSIE